ncbi:hypothetical protein CS8_008070 [Cupriavidus sp. 8B]
MLAAGKSINDDESKPGRQGDGPSELIDARAAMAMLGIKSQTLYSYVSRGFIRAVSAPPGSKGSLYYRQDVEVLQMRRRKDRPRVQMAQRALRIGGEPVLKSTITAITNEGPVYRGLPAIELARSGVPSRTAQN